MESADEGEETVDAEEEVVDSRVLDVDHRHDQLLVFVLQQLSFYHVQQLSDHLNQLWVLGFYFTIPIATPGYGQEGKQC